MRKPAIHSLWFHDRHVHAPGSRHPFSLHVLAIELRQKRRIALRQLAVDLQADINPATNPMAVMQVRPLARAVARMRLMIAAAGAQRPGPAGAAIDFVRNVMALEKGPLRLAIDAVADTAQTVPVRSGKTVAQRDIAAGRDAEKTEAGAAGIGLAHALVELLQRSLDVGGSVVPVGDRRLEKLKGELAELTEHLVVAALRNRMPAVGRGGHRREADFPEPDVF